MVSKGKIDFQTFADSMQEGLGGAALAAGDTFSGALANVKAALSRLGEGPGQAGARIVAQDVQRGHSGRGRALKPAHTVRGAVERQAHPVCGQGRQAHRAIQPGLAGRQHHRSGHRRQSRPIGRSVRIVRRGRRQRGQDHQRVRHARQNRRRPDSTNSPRA